MLAGIDRRKHYNLRGARFEGAEMNCFMEFAPGIGMHAGNLTPNPSSHGCIRLPASAAEQFFHLIDVGCPVRVDNLVPSDFDF
jgi:hypothetical protein